MSEFIAAATAKTKWSPSFMFGRDVYEAFCLIYGLDEMDDVIAAAEEKRARSAESFGYAARHGAVIEFVANTERGYQLFAAALKEARARREIADAKCQLRSVAEILALHGIEVTVSEPLFPADAWVPPAPTCECCECKEARS